MSLCVGVLAGGASSRMGTDKAAVLFDGVTLGERAVALARSIADDVVVLGHGLGMPAGLLRVTDAVGAGPCAGVAALVLSGRAAKYLVLAVDMPRIRDVEAHMLLAALSSAPAAHFSAHPLPCALRAGLRLATTGALHEALTAQGCVRLPLTHRAHFTNINSALDVVAFSRAPRLN